MKVVLFWIIILIIYHLNTVYLIMSYFENKEFQHRLIGYNDNWTNWSSEPTASFNNLMYGSYTF